MPRKATNSNVASIEVEVDRPGDRGRKKDQLRGPTTSDSTSGSGSSGTLLTNNSEANWWLDGLGGYVLPGSAATTPLDVAISLEIKDGDGTTVTTVEGWADSLPWSVPDGHLIRPGWSIDYTITQGSGTSYSNISLNPFVRKAEPGSGSSSPSTDPTPIIDDFESQSLSAYTGDTGQFSFNTSDTFSADASLEMTGESTANFDSIWSAPGDGLDNYPTKGDSFSYAHKASTVADTGIRYDGVYFDAETVAASASGYYVQTIWDAGVIRLYLEDSGDATLLDQQYHNLSADSWYTVAVDYDATINVTHQDSDGETVAQLAASDVASDSQKGGKIGFGGEMTGSSEWLRWDYAHLTN